MVAHRLAGWSNGEGPLYLQLAASIASLIDEGVLGDGDQLPAERALANELAVSRGTVVAAFSLLSDQQRVERRQGSGTIVRAASPSYRPDDHRGTSSLFDPPRGDAIELLLAMPLMTPAILELLQNVQLDPTSGLLDNAEPAGVMPLRVAIADRMTIDGLPTKPEQILVANGAQQALALTTAMLLQPGDVVLTEEVTWPGLVDLVRASGAKLHGVRVDHDGVVVDELRSAVERLRPSLIVLNPQHHNPTGTRLAVHRHQPVADIAADYGVPLIEDRVAAALGFDGRLAPPLAALRPEASHFVVDSVNKLAFPGLRIGWVRAEPQAIERLRAAKATLDLFASIPSQLMALEILEHYDTVRAGRVEELELRHAVLTDAVSTHLPEWVQNPVRGGLCIWVGLPRGSASDFARFAARYGVSVAGSQEFSASSVVDDHIRLPFTRPPEHLVEGVRRLGLAWADYDADGIEVPPETLTPPALI